jgi:hypothetical protein
MGITSRGTYRSRLLGLLAMIALCGASLFSPPPAIGQTSGLPTGEAAQYDGVLSLPDGSIQLLATAGPPPSALGSYERFGSYLSAPRKLDTPSTSFSLSYHASLPSGSALSVDLRGSLDGSRWSEWETDLPSGQLVRLPRPASFVQYRLSLLAGGAGLPALHSLSLTPVQGGERYSAAAGATPVAPTFRLRATRMGMVGGRTANGYIIQPHARFVSLPSWRSLAPKGSHEYSVRITYKGRSSVAPVWDVGPYNTRDNYWSAERERFNELPRGWPQDHAAYYEGHNGGWGEKGYVRFPTAIDVGDGVWWDDLGINGDQAEVEVTFLWLGSDPLAGKQPRAYSPEQVIDELSPDFWRSSPHWGSSPVGCGEGRHAYTASSVVDAAQSARVARWQPILPAEATYELYVHVPVCPSKQKPSAQVRYLIQHRDGAVEMLIDQTRQTGWVSLGRFPFVANDSGFIQLSDVTGEPGRTIWFDQAKWVIVP